MLLAAAEGEVNEAWDAARSLNPALSYRCRLRQTLV